MIFALYIFAKTLDLYGKIFASLNVENTSLRQTVLFVRITGETAKNRKLTLLKMNKMLFGHLK